MDYYSKQYFKESEDWKRSHAKPLEGRKTLQDEISYLSQSKHVEVDSFFRVRNAVLNVAGGISDWAGNEQSRNEFMMDTGRQAAREGGVQIREPEVLKNLIAKGEEDGNAWGIVSVSWSRRFILGALVEAGLLREDQVEDVAKNIRCNELLAPVGNAYEQSESSTRMMCTAQDKYDALCGLLKHFDTELNARESKVTESRMYQNSNIGQNATLTIYVGDSTTDLGCLVGPAIGMYLSDAGKESPVLQTLERLNLRCLFIDQLPTSNTQAKLTAMMEHLKDEMPDGQSRFPYLVCRIRRLQELGDWLSKVS